MARGQLATQGAIGELKTQLWEQIVNKRLMSPLGLLLLLVLTLPLAWVLSHVELKILFVIMAACIGLPMVLFALFNPAFNLGLMLFTALTVTFLLRFVTAPIGLLMDTLIVVGVLAVLIQQFRVRDWSFMNNGLSYIILIWLFYNGLQVLNPWADSILAWLYTVRSVALQLLVFFVGAFALRKNEKAIYRLFYFILFLCIVCALYGMKQQYLDFMPAEMAWIMADKNRHQLFFQWNMMRIPSMCTDPTTFGILMSCFSIITAILMLSVKNYAMKVLWAVMTIIALMTMGFSGTRTAVVLIPIGVAFYMLLTLDRRVLLIGGAFLLFGAALMLKSTSIGVIYRLQSAFKPSKDDSMVLRLKNQKRIQPFILSHPIGAGLGSCGVWGARFSPGSWLSTFQHDSSFVRMAVEVGWIGLILYTLMHFMAIYTGIYYFFRCRDPWIKTMYAAITTVCYMLAVACYAQEAILQQPMNTIYNVFLAMLVTLKNFDPAYQEASAGATQA